MPGVGLELKEGVQIAKLTEAYGADAIDVSCGTYETLNHLMEVTTYPLGWRTYLAKAVKQEVSIPVIAVGMIRTPDQAESLLENGSMDFIGLGRPLIADPYWMKKAEEGRSEDIVRCIACQTCKMTQMKNAPGGETGRCALNPRACHEYEYPPVGRRNGEQRKVVIVGAGPGGLTAARELAMRDFDVIVYEKRLPQAGSCTWRISRPARRNTRGRPWISSVPPKKPEQNFFSAIRRKRRKFFGRSIRRDSCHRQQAPWGFRSRRVPSECIYRRTDPARGRGAAGSGHPALRIRPDGP